MTHRLNCRSILGSGLGISGAAGFGSATGAVQDQAVFPPVVACAGDHLAQRQPRDELTPALVQP